MRAGPARRGGRSGTGKKRSTSVWKPSVSRLGVALSVMFSPYCLIKGAPVSGGYSVIFKGTYKSRRQKREHGDAGTQRSASMKMYPVAPGFLGLVHRHIGVFKD